MKYRAIQLQGKGGLDQLRSVELPLDDPKPGELQIRVRAAGVGFTDITMRRSYDPYRPPFPFVPGYEVLGEVDTLGAGVIGFQKGQRVCALTVHDAWAEYFTREADHFVPVPDGVDDGEAVALILNYVTAYQMIYRYGMMQPGELALVSGANGGVGTALLELLKLHGVRAIGAAARKHFDYVRQLGGHPIESRSRPLDVLPWCTTSFRKASMSRSTAWAEKGRASTSAPPRRAAWWWATVSWRRAPHRWGRCAVSRRYI